MKTKLNLPKEATFVGPAVVWKRIAAFIVDMIILDFVIGTPLRSVLTNIVPNKGFSDTYSYLSTNSKIAAAISLIFFMYGILAILYFAILEYKTGQTIGKMLFNITIKSDREDMSFLQCIMRSIYLLMIFPLILLWIADPVFMIFSKEKRRLSEIISKTRTIEVYLLR